MSGPTRSESANRLIQTCLEAAAGRCGPDAVEALLGEREQGLAQHADAFDQKLTAQSDDFVKAVRLEHEGVQRAFRRYGEALRLIRAWLDSGDAGTLDRALKLLAAAGNEVLDALATWDVAVMTARGPTDHPVLNTLLTVCAAPTLEPATLAPVVAQMRAMLRQAQATERGAPPLVERLRAGAAEYDAALDDLDGFVSSGDRACVERGSAHIVETAARLRDGAVLLRAAAQAPGPTGFPLANALINAHDAVVDGRVPASLVAEVTGTIERAFVTMRTQLAPTLSTQSPSAVFAEEAARTQAALAQHDEALADLRRFVDSQDVEAYRRGIEGLRVAVVALAQARSGFDQVAAREGKVVCVWCDFPNTPHAHQCGRCNRLLPRWTETGDASSTFSMSETGEVDFQSGSVATAHVERLAEAAEAVASGQLSGEAFLDLLAENDDRIAAAENSLSRHHHAYVDRTREGLGWFRQGLYELRAFLDDGDPAHLTAGMQTVREAAEILHASQQAARETR